MDRLGLLFEVLTPRRPYPFVSFLTSNLFATNASRQVARRKGLIPSGKCLDESQNYPKIILCQMFREQKWEVWCWSSRLQDTTKQTLMDIFDELLDPSRDDTRYVLLYIKYFIYLKRRTTAIGALSSLLKRSSDNPKVVPFFFYSRTFLQNTLSYLCCRQQECRGSIM